MKQAKKGMFFLYRYIVRPVSSNREQARKEFILNILLLGILLLASLAFIQSMVNYYFSNELYYGVTPQTTLSFLLFFIYLLYLSKSKRAKLSSFLFLSFLFASATYTALLWGSNVPQAILVYALVIVISGILVDSKFAFIMASLVFLVLVILLELSSSGIVEFNISWAKKPPDIKDIMVNSATLFVIALVSWLSNREIEKALNRARKSEENLRKERDMLEVNVAEKTRQLRQVWEKERTNMQEFASIGRHTIGVIHDLVTPLTTLSLNLKMLKTNNHSRLITKATQASDQIERYIEMTRQKLNHKDMQKNFSLSGEITKAKKSLARKSQAAQVKILSLKSTVEIFGNPPSFHQLVLNLLDNAIDSYTNPTFPSATLGASKKREVLVDIKQNKQNVFLTVTDYGQGIAFRDLKRIFDPFFTTKGSAGKMGIGLAICKEIAEKDFGGTIGVKSRLNQGTTFVIKLPILKKKYERQNA